MTNTEKLHKLLDEVDENDRQELQILQSAVESNRSACQREFTANNKKNWDAAREGLQEAIDRLWSRYMVQEERFKSRKEVLEYLNSNGYGISQGKLYGDCKKGLLKLQADKSVLMSSVQAYINNPESKLVKHAEVGQRDEDEKTYQEKLKYEVSILKTKDEKQKFDFDKERGKYIPRDEFELELAARAAVLDSGLTYWLKSNIAEWIQICGGTQDKRSELLQTLLEGKDQRLNEFATTDRFQVMLLAAEEDDE